MKRTWTEVSPTEVGWYWIDCPALFRRHTIVELFIRPAHSYVCIMDPNCCAHTKRNFIPVHGLDARWSGPLLPPEETDLV